MAKKKRYNFQTGLFAMFFVLLFFWVMFVFVGGKGTFLEERSKAQPSVYAGYFNSGMLDYCFEAFIDSTYIVYTVLDTVEGKWYMENDTLFLKNEQQICAKIYQEELLDFSCEELKPLSEMELKYYERARVALFPKPE